MKETSNRITGVPEPLPPPSLQKGDTIGLTAPAGPLLDEEHFSAGVRLIKEMGFQVKFARDLPKRRDAYLAGPDDLRLKEFQDLWADPEVKAIMAVRGGYGSLRLADRLDYDLIRRNPKILVGFSDITVLLNAVYKNCGLITFHGPVLTSLARGDRRTVQEFFELLTGRTPDPVKPAGLEILKSGQGRGRLTGGNLTTLSHLLATPHEISWDNTLLFLEDVDEAPYRIDRMLTQLKQAGRLQKISGLILGSFNDGLNADHDTVDEEIIWQRTLELLSDTEIPIWANFPGGHIKNNRTLPFGVTAEMDSTSATLRFLDPAVAPKI